MDKLKNKLLRLLMLMAAAICVMAFSSGATAVQAAEGTQQIAIEEQDVALAESAESAEDDGSGVMILLGGMLLIIIAVVVTIVATVVVTATAAAEEI